MLDKDFNTLSQRDFLRYVGDLAAPVSYHWPGCFRSGNQQVSIKLEGSRLSLFLAKLHPLMTFGDYDHLCRSVWVAHMQAERQHSSTYSPFPPPGR